MNGHLPMRKKSATKSKPVVPPIKARELAPHLGMTERGVVLAARRGDLPHIRVGRSFRFNFEEVMNHVSR